MEWVRYRYDLHLSPFPVGYKWDDTCDEKYANVIRHPVTQAILKYRK